MKIGIVGWGYVGAATGLGLKDKHEILIYDPYKEVVDFSINLLGELPSTKNLSNLKQISNLKDLSKAELIFICLPTPSKENGKADLSYIDNFLKELNSTLESGIIVIRSTVPPKTTIKYQEMYPKFKFVHNPEFFRIKTPLHDFLYPHRIVVGSNSEEAMKKVLELYKDFECIKIKTNSTASEMIKYASNCFLASKISYFNEIHKICEKLGIDSKIVSEAVSLDERIGKYGIYGGKPFGGTCLPKDLDALIFFLEKEIGFNPHFLNAVKKVNEEYFESNVETRGE